MLLAELLINELSKSEEKDTKSSESNWKSWDEG